MAVRASVAPKAFPSSPTRDRIVAAAAKLFYSEGIRAVGVDAVAEKAGVTKRTLYYHFRSKDDLVAAYLEGRDQPNLALFRQWFEETPGELPAKVEGIFRNLARAARHPKWKGCGFLRTSAELANLPGHPAIKIGAAHKKKFEGWLRETFAEAGIDAPEELARQMLLLLDGSFAVVLLHRDPSYMETAGAAAAKLVAVALPRSFNAARGPRLAPRTGRGSRAASAPR
ncbi:TetR/AcrR family transcriptional regulator [Rhodopseudomonas palustris]|uniref:TetR/AcrR family transcriptional regulator n=1 Tax=Rhodopseudomonas palustris TaxID=1076 RepID=UPI0022EFD8B8|nr:TetR/AcrR family transcriptional regulator [Rhodopseudomonas palustris]WBU29429.1 TetR/AcrR family transcriptional regulator [Rhodopseudomonas palustris]